MKAMKQRLAATKAKMEAALNKAAKPAPKSAIKMFKPKVDQAPIAAP